MDKFKRAIRGTMVVVALGAGAAAAACSDSSDGAASPAPDAGIEAAVRDSSGDAEPPSTCGITIPASYASASYDTNAAVEIALRKQFDALLKPMKDAETAFANMADGGAAPAPITKAQLSTLYAAGTPSVKSITTAFHQGRVDGWMQAYEDAFVDGAYAPVDPPDAGDKGGVYGKWVFDARGLDLRQAIEKGTYIAGFYNHALSALASGPITEATIDRLVAAFGAHPSFPGDPAAAQNKDVNSAAYAARRSKDPNLVGPYAKIKAALIKAKASVAAGEKCGKDRDDALKVFFAEWERSNYATVVYYFNDVIKKLGATDSSALLHSYGECIGFIGGFRGIPQDKRIITDAQIDSLLTAALAPNGGDMAGYKLHTSSATAGAGLQQVITEIKGIYGFSDAEMAAFKNFN